MERMSKPKFIKEIEKSEGKERAKCGRWYIRVYGELDHKPMVELESLEIVVKELHKLEEENKKLKSDLAFERTMLDNVRAEHESLQNVIKELNEDIKEIEKNQEYRYHRCMKAERQVQHSLGGDDEEGLYD